MSIPSISPYTPAYAQGADATAARLPAQTLDQNDFLRLLVTELTTQDPLSPKKDSEFIAQMAQFTTLEQFKSMQKDLAQLRSDQQLLQANNLLGRSVEIQNGPVRTAGIVSSVQVADGKPALLVDGKTYALEQLLTIAPSATLG